MNFGKFLEGISYKHRPTTTSEVWQLVQAAVHVTARTPHFLWSTSSPHTDVIHATFPGGGESMVDVETRARHSLESLLENHPQERHFAIVSHKQTNKILLASLLWNNVLECERVKQQST
jgi:broad specificity phosphatase PhoE